MIDRSTLRHFGLAQRGWFRSQLHQVYESEIGDAVTDNQLLAIIGPFGAGKSELVSGALRQMQSSARQPVHIVRVQDPHRENQKISHVMNAAIYDLSNENPRRDAEARARQFIRVIGEKVVRQKHRVVIIVENAHRLHPATLMAIKDAREMGFADEKGPLYSVILVGQGRLQEMLKRQPEIGHRTTVVDLTEDAGWMTFDERVRYLDAVYNGAIAPDTQQRLAERALTPLSLDAAVEEAMRAAKRAGHDKVDDRTVRLSLDQLKDLTEVSLRDIERISGVPHTTVSDVLKRGEDHPQAPAVREALERLRNDQRGDGEAPRSKAA